MHQIFIRFFQCVLVGACFYSPLVLPVAVDGLYETTVAVEDRSQSAQRRGFMDAMDVVLVKLTGNMAAAQDPELAPLLDNASAYVQRFGYDDKGMLRVGFDGAAIENQLVGLGKAIWGRERPVTLVWLAIDNGQGERRLIGANEKDPIAVAMREVAAKRGIPLIFPLLDAQDASEVAFIDVWGGFDEKLKLASARYRADAILVGRIRREVTPNNARTAAPRAGPEYGDELDSDQTWARWILLYQTQTEHWRGNLANGVNRTADFFASLFAASTKYAGQFAMLVVDGIGDFQSYARVSKYLESLSAVNEVNIDGVENDRVYYRLALRTDVTGLQRAIGLGQTLETPGFDDDAVNAIPATGLYYRLRP